MRYLGLWILGVVIVLGGAAALAFHKTSGGSEPSSLSSDSTCGRLMMDGHELPTRAPDNTATTNVTDGDPFNVTKLAGIWRARIVAENATFASYHPGVPPPPGGRVWTGVFNMGWCFSRDTPEEFLARGNGTISVSWWKGEDETFRVARGY